MPLSDFGGQGASVHYKAWVCTSPNCDYNIKIRNGDIHLNEPIFEGPRDADVTFRIPTGVSVSSS